MAKAEYAALLANVPEPFEKGSSAHLAKKYLTARRNLLSVVIFTTINLFLLLLDGSTYMLFSASIPYYLPAFAKAVDDILMEGHYLTWGAYGISMASILFYLLCWHFGKERRGWMIAALVMFALDCLGLIGLVVLTQTPVDFILDIVFHIWVMYYLVSAARSSSKLNRLLAEADAAPASPEFD